MLMTLPLPPVAERISSQNTTATSTMPTSVKTLDQILPALGSARLMLTLSPSSFQAVCMARSASES